MAKSVILNILDQEGTSFYRIDRRWQPKSLIPDPYRRNLLKDALERFAKLEAGATEFEPLDRAPLYFRLLQRMRLSLKRAQLAWRSDDLKFIENIASFFSDYGTILQNLKIDQARGKFSETT